MKKKSERHQEFSGGQLVLPQLEEKVLEYWRTNQIFEKSLDERRGRKTFVFYEGPPYANGKPGIHHVLARIYKDIILRYKTMRGYFVPRRAGWDTHGLPVEMAAEKALGLKSKRDIEKFGIELFNRKAKESVWIYKDEWERMTRRIGYWLDLTNAYVTYEADYIETLWWIIKRIGEKKLLFRGHKVVPWCPRCGTALSSHELAQGYEEVKDQSVYVKFRLREGQRIGAYLKTDNQTYILSWTTTPWTLPGNVALAVGKDIVYLLFRPEGSKEKYIVAKDLFGSIFEGVKGTELTAFQGKDLAGLRYLPLFPIASLKNRNSHALYPADFVTTDEGTGVVHTAVMYGEDDYQLGVKVDLPQHHTVKEEGKFTREVPGLGGLPVKSKKTEERIFAYLKKKNFLFRIEPYTHEYPFCWRCETPLIYYARQAWFIAMTKLRSKLLSENQRINWIPKYLKEGRFGEWIREVKDWNFSRERYWGTPLPIWECKKCGQTECIGSRHELEERIGPARNKYWVMRHGESETQLKRIIDSGQKAYHLTTIGKDQAREAAEHLKKEGIDLILASDIQRTKETAKIVARTLGIKKVLFDRRLREIYLPTLAGCHSEKYHRLFPTLESRFEKRPERGESLRDLRARMWRLLHDLERKYRDKKILLVSHEYPLWMLTHAALGWSEREAIRKKAGAGEDFLRVGEYRHLNFRVGPRNQGGEFDLHRPYIDRVEFQCEKCGGTMQRIPEVADVWFDSGAMPFAQGHWPFAQHPTSNIQHPTLPKEYPADYIAEGMDQTRGWFYTLLAVATALGYGAPYKNVISLGLVNDKYGQKMSKSKGNIVEPFSVIQKYGADAVRWYFYTVNPPGETKNFDDSEILKAYRRFHLILWNSLLFYRTYAREKRSTRRRTPRKNVLDRWIVARLHETIEDVTKDLEHYEIREAALALENFVDDVSRWYIRRSRRRFSAALKGYGGQTKNGDYQAASQTLGFVLREFTKLIAPFTPFFAEMLYSNIQHLTPNTQYRESIHLTDWPTVRGRKLDAGSRNLLHAMEEVRKIASAALAKRAEAGIKVRQPLAMLKIKNPVFAPRLRAGRQKSKINKDLLVLLMDEVNVKKVIYDSQLKEEIAFDTRITPELREEGILREIIRMIQDLRQRAHLEPRDRITTFLELPTSLHSIIRTHEKILKSEVGAKEVHYKRSTKFDAEISTKLEESYIWIAVKKV